MNKKLEQQIIAHRGESFLAPENTLAAINLAWMNGAFAVEIDVHLTLDNKIVVIHDNNTQRTGDSTKTIKKTNFKDIRTIDVGVFKDKQWKGERIPTLSEVFQTVPGHGKLIIEIKCGKEIIPIFVDEIKKSPLKISQIEIISFNLKVLSETKKYLPEYKMLWLLNMDYYLPTWLLKCGIRRTIHKVVKKELDGVDVWAGKLLDKRFVSLCKEYQLLIYTWTIDDANTAQKLLVMGVDAITTNRPEWLKKQLLNNYL